MYLNSTWKMAGIAVAAAWVGGYLAVTQPSLRESIPGWSG